MPRMSLNVGMSNGWNRGWKGRTYQALRVTNDINAVRRRKIAPRLARRGLGKLSGRLIGWLVPGR